MGTMSPAGGASRVRKYAGLLLVHPPAVHTLALTEYSVLGCSGAPWPSDCMFALVAGSCDENTQNFVYSESN